MSYEAKISMAEIAATEPDEAAIKKAALNLHIQAETAEEFVELLQGAVSKMSALVGIWPTPADPEPVPKRARRGSGVYRCGLCKEEGHRRNLCPRNPDAEVNRAAIAERMKRARAEQARARQAEDLTAPPPMSPEARRALIADRARRMS